MIPPVADADDLRRKLEGVGYFADPDLALVVWLSLALERPLLVEGPAGTGKTDLARALAAALGRDLVRLQCYEGLDASKALYDWDYGKQMLYTQLLRDQVAEQVRGAANLKDAAERIAASEGTFYDRRFLLERPVLRAIASEAPVVFLVDEIDRADPEFEALLLEVLAEGQITIPELGTVRGAHRPAVVLTSNASREMSDALRRRCLHAFLGYPTPAREQQILEQRVPGLAADLAAQLARFAEKLRGMNLSQAPSLAETIDWGRALVLLGASALDAELARTTLGVLLKNGEDRDKVAAAAGRLVG